MPIFLKKGTLALIIAFMMPILFSGCGDPAKNLYIDANNLELTRVYSRAIPKYENIINKYPKSHYAVLSEFGIANCYNGLGENDKAIALYDAFLVKFPHEKVIVDILWQKAEVYRNMGDNNKAIEVYKELVAKFPKSDYVKEAKNFIASVEENMKQMTGTSQEASAKILEIVKFSFPKKLSVGQEGAINLVIKNSTTDSLNSVKIQIDLKYWKGIKVKKITPDPISIQEFWGKRIWEYPVIEPGKQLEMTAIIVGDVPGKYEGALTFEANLEDSNLKVPFVTEVLP